MRNRSRRRDRFGRPPRQLSALNTSKIATTAASVGVSLVAGSKDAAVLITLPPRSSTALLRGVGETTGVALVEVYHVP